jgi:hypothetical protein
VTDLLTIDFGAGGNADPFVAGGWGAAGAESRWMTGAVSELRFAAGELGGDCLIDFEFHPWVSPPVLGAQRLTVSCNGVVIGESTLLAPGRFGYRVPAAACAAGQSASLLIAHLDAARPCDLGPSEDARLLSAAVRRVRVLRMREGAAGQQISGNGGLAPHLAEQLCGLPPERLMLQFESLGDNCEFGLVQRLYGAEPFFSLLRFAGMEFHHVLTAFDRGLQDFGCLENLSIDVQGRDNPELVIVEKHYNAMFHTFRQFTDVDQDALRTGESKRLAYMAKLFVSDLKKAKKIFVVKRNQALTFEEIVPLYLSLAAYGRNTLLWVVPADAAHASGTVEVVMPGLFKGYIERFAPPERADDLLLEPWLELCTHAYQLAQVAPAHLTAHIPS